MLGLVLLLDYLVWIEFEEFILVEVSDIYCIIVVFGWMVSEIC